MNQFFYESRGKEKVNELIDEGVRSQAYHRSAVSKAPLSAGIKFTLIILGISGVIVMIIR
jgi:hypothetical protein